MHDLCGVMNALKPRAGRKDAIILVEHEAKHVPLSTPDGFDLYDSRKYGVAGVQLLPPDSYGGIVNGTHLRLSRQL